MARPSGRGSARRRASRTRARRDCLSGIASRLGLAQGVVSTALGYALPKIVGLLTPGGVVPAGVPAEVTGFLSQPRAAAGDGTGRAAAGRRLSGERAERIRRPALAMAGARGAGRRWPAFLFLVDAQPDAVRSARRKGAGACGARASTVAQAPPPPPAPSPAAQAPAPAPSPSADAQTPAPAPQPAAQAPAPAP